MNLSTGLLVFLALGLLISCNLEGNQSKKEIVNTFIDKEDTRGVILNPNDKEIPLSEKNINSRFLPTLEEVELAESILQNNLKDFLSTSVYQHETMFTDSLGNYNRQYAGFINRNNEKEILINFLWASPFFDEEMEEEYKTHWITVWDGGEYYWRITVNLENERIHSISVNGKA